MRKYGRKEHKSIVKPSSVLTCLSFTCAYTARFRVLSLPGTMAPPWVLLPLLLLATSARGEQQQYPYACDSKVYCM